MDTFDDFWNFDEEADDAVSTTDMPRIPEGTHTLKVKAVAVVQAKSDKLKDPEKNPQGVCLQLILEKKGHKWLYCDTPFHWRSRIEAICRACSAPVPTKGTPVSTLLDQIDSKEVTVVVENNEWQGNLYPKVVNWKPAAKKAEAAPPPPKEKARKKKSGLSAAYKKQVSEKLEEAYESDDIPF
jgi:hypothetical protein